MASACLAVLSDEQLATISAATFALLRDVGVCVPSAEVRALLVGAGARCDGERVALAPGLVRDCLAQVPRSFSICGRCAPAAVTIGDGRTHIQPMVGRLHILDRDGTTRRTTLDDVGRIVALCERLGSYDVLHGGAVMPHIEGIPDALAPVAGFLQTLRHTTKPFKGTCRGADAARACISLARVVAEATGVPFALHTTCNTVSPLTLPRDMSAGALEYIRAGWPVDFASEPQMGATSPVTLAATIVQTMAECLAGVVLAQVVNPGTPVLAGTVGAALDMRHATIALGGVEAALLNAAHAQVASHLGIPSRGTGPNTNAKALDFQAGYEKSLTTLVPVLAGIDLLFYPGTLEHAETVSLEALVLDDDLCSIALRAQRGIRVSDELLSFDLIRTVGPGGSFLALPQTAREMFAEHHVRGLWDRRRRGDWVAAGSPTPLARAAEAVDRHLAAPPAPLDDRLTSALRRRLEQLVPAADLATLVGLLSPSE